MGYLFDQLPFGRSTIDCPDLYPFAMVVEVTRADRYAPFKPEDVLGLAIKAVLPDVEDWQFSVIDENRVKFRFHDQAQREIAKNAVQLTVEPGLVIDRVTLRNPPDVIV